MVAQQTQKPAARAPRKPPGTWDKASDQKNRSTLNPGAPIFHPNIIGNYGVRTQQAGNNDDGVEDDAPHCDDAHDLMETDLTDTGNTCNNETGNELISTRLLSTVVHSARTGWLAGQ